MTIRELLQYLDGAGLIITDEDLLEEELQASNFLDGSGLSLDSELEVVEY
jgi:hypothetical protein